MSSCTKINWGIVIAGAAAVTGAVLLFPAVQEPVMDIVKNIGNGLKDAVAFIGNLFTQQGSQLQSMSEGTQTTLKYVAGATLLGGAGAYALTHDHKQECPHMAREALEMQRAGWAEGEQLRAMQAIQQSRMMAAGQIQQAMGRA